MFVYKIILNNYLTIIMTLNLDIPPSVIQIAFEMARFLCAGFQIKYLAIQLYEKFIYCYYWKIYRIILDTGRTRILNCAFEYICRDKALHLMTCFRLVCKMESSAVYTMREVNIF